MLYYNFHAVYMANKTTKLILFSFIIFNVIVYGQNQVDHKLDPVIKSLIIACFITAAGVSIESSS